MSAEVSLRSSLAGHHLRAAAYFARELGRIETDHDELKEGLFIQHRGLSIGAVVTAVCALEAGINEVYIDAAEKRERPFEGANPKVPLLLSTVWSSVERSPILAKYQVALIHASGQEMAKGKPPYQPTESLVKLRDALVHFKPEWDNDLKAHKKIEERLFGLFAECRYYSPREAAFFPKRCLGYGCAQWAVATVLAFTTEFCAKMRLEPFFGPGIEPELRTCPSDEHPSSNP